MSAAEREPMAAAFACQMRLAADPEYLEGAGDSYHVSGRACRNGHRVSSSTWPRLTPRCLHPALPRPCTVAKHLRRWTASTSSVLLLRGRRSGLSTAAARALVSLCTFRRCHARELSSERVRSNFVYHGERNSVWTFIKNMPGPLLWMYLPQHIALNVAALLYYPGADRAA